MSELFLLGVSHHTAPVELRERLDFSKRDVSDALVALASHPICQEAIVLSTCNRAELYVVCDESGSARAALTSFLCDFHGVTHEMLAPYLYGLTDLAAVRHVFRVAAGLDSLVVGEPQILGQVKEAYAAATEQHTTGSLLNRLFHMSFATGKRVRSETELGEGAVSVSYAAVGLARKIFGDLRTLGVLLIGAGEMAELTAMHLRAQPVRQIIVTSRTASHAEAIAAKVDGHAVSWSGIPDALASADIVVTATGSPAPIVTTPQVDAVMRARRNRPLFIIDIAVPRDVDAAVGAIDQVFLYNIDDLQTIVTENLAHRGAQIDRAEEIVSEEVALFASWLRFRGAVPTVVALRQRFEGIRQAELKRLEPKLASLTPAARARVEEVTRLIVEKLLLTPTEQLKALSDQDTVSAYSDALSQLFDLEPVSANPEGGSDRSQSPSPSPKTPVTS